MSKSPDAFRSIGEVSRLIGVAPHVLRYWESQFTQLAPVKRADGRRYYRPDDVRLVAGLCQVMREEGLSIRGAKRLIAADRGAGLRQIGAARLDENQNNGGASGRPAAAPAVQLAVPTPVQPPGPPAQDRTAPAPAAGSEHGPQPDRITAAEQPRAPRRRKAEVSDNLPLFADTASDAAPIPAPAPARVTAHPAPPQPMPMGADPAWLDRLIRTALALRLCETRGTPAPVAQMQDLRDRLNNALHEARRIG